MYSLETIVNKITSYSDIFLQYGFFKEGVGDLPYSTRYVRGDETIEMNANGWVFYVGGFKYESGGGPSSLLTFLSNY